MAAPTRSIQLVYFVDVVYTDSVSYIIESIVPFKGGADIIAITSVGGNRVNIRATSVGYKILSEPREYRLNFRSSDVRREVSRNDELRKIDMDISCDMIEDI